ncbi:MAG: type II toxin-antitoxin system HicA family toxin [Dehalococcoidia bacterium]|nr:type II toxin-antitoxin system HicA family toxin [Dehalococcoidia bacterium]
MRVAERLGWVHERTAGDHWVFRLEGNPENLAIADHRELKPGMVRRHIRTMGITVDEFLRRARK